jgi:hypothetical protein
MKPLGAPQQCECKDGPRQALHSMLLMMNITCVSFAVDVFVGQRKAAIFAIAGRWRCLSWCWCW